MSRKWFILHAGSHREEKLRRNLVTRLEANGLEKLVPRLLVPSKERTELRNGKRRSLLENLLPGYLAAEIECEADGSIPPAIRDTIGETNLGPMSDEEAALLLRRLEAREAPVAVDLEPGEHVLVREGSFEGRDGTIFSVHPERGVVKVDVAAFGRLVPLELEYWKVERAPSPGP